MHSRAIFSTITCIASIAFMAKVTAMETPDTSYHQSIVEGIYTSPSAQENPILKKIAGMAPTYTYYETNSAKEAVIRGFWIKNPFNTTPPEDYYAFQHDMSVDRGSEKTYWNPPTTCNEADCILAERYELYKHCSIWLDKSWLRTASMSIGIVDAERISEIQRIVLSHLKTNKNGITTEENTIGTKQTGKEYTRISHVVHILEESFSQPAQAPFGNKSEIAKSQNPQSPAEQSPITAPAIPQQHPHAFSPKHFWQRRFFWPTVSVACFLGGLFTCRSYISSFLNQLRAQKS